MKKLLAVGVIVLFLGLAFTPSINANINKASIDSELVEFTTEVYGLNGGKHTVQLTKAEAKEVEQLIDDIERRLDKVETREETVEIFNEVVVELDKYGLLGDLSIKQAQKLVTGGYQNSRLMKLLQKIFIRYKSGNDEIDNSLCLVAGRTESTMILTTIDRFNIRLHDLASFLLYKARDSDYYIWLFFFVLWFGTMGLADQGNLINMIIPIDIFTMICSWDFIEEPLEGWLFTLGMKGKQSINGSFYGQNPVFRSLLEVAFLYQSYWGVFGFVGIALWIFSNPDNWIELDFFYIGGALRVNVGTEPPKI